MRVVVGCLAVIGVVVLLLVAGCVGLIGFGVATAVQDIPPYATQAETSRRHAADLALINEAISRQRYDGLAAALSDDVLALYRDEDEVLQRQQFSGKSFWMMNGGGIGTLTVNGRSSDCVVYRIPGAAGRDEHTVFFKDAQARSAGQPVERPDNP